jgi:hypothetical protein
MFLFWRCCKITLEMVYNFFGTETASTFLLNFPQVKPFRINQIKGKELKNMMKISSKFSILLLLLFAFAISISAQTITTTRNFMYPGFFKDTRTGAGLLANGVNKDIAADIAFSLLGDTLNLAADKVTGGSVGAMQQAATIGSGKNVDLIGSGINALRKETVQLPRMAKFKRTDAVYLQYDSGKWCFIPNGSSLRVIRGDLLDPMIRTDIPSNAGAQECRMPDGFYLGSDGRTVYMAYSSSKTDESWYGIGYGNSYCGVPNEAWWQTFVVEAFTRLHPFDWNNVRQPTLTRITGVDQNTQIFRGRTSTGVCKVADAQDKGVSITQTEGNRTILFPEHFKASGHGAALVVTAKGTSVLGDALTSNTAEYLSGAAGIPFYGTGAKLVAALNAPDTSLPRMVKRSSSDAVYLQYDDGSYCFMNTPDQLSVMRGGKLAVAINDSLPANVQSASTKVCGFPDGFFKEPDDANGRNVSPQVYYLFSSSANNPSWYGMGFGDSYCKIPNEATWRTLIGFAGGDGGAPQDSLVRVPIDKLFQTRTEKPCPTNMVNGVAQ